MLRLHWVDINGKHLVVIDVARRYVEKHRCVSKSILHLALVFRTSFALHNRVVSGVGDFQCKTNSLVFAVAGEVLVHGGYWDSAK